MNRRGMVIGSVVLLLAAAAGYFFNGFSLAEQETVAVTPLPLVTGCQLHQGPCTAELPSGGSVTFEMTPRPLPTAEPMTLQARFSGVQPDRVVVMFEGKDMYMGFLQYRLKPTDEVGLFSGKGSLSLCTRRLMEWYAKVQITVGGVRYELPFAFETLKS